MKIHELESNIKEQLYKVVGNGEISVSLDFAETISAKHSNFHKAILQTKTRYNELEKQNRAGLLDSKDYFTLRSKISADLLSIIEKELSYEDTNEYANTKKFIAEIEKLKKENKKLTKNIDSLTSIIEGLTKIKTKSVTNLELNFNLLIVPSAKKRVKIVNFNQAENSVEPLYEEAKSDDFFISEDKITFEHYYEFLTHNKIEELSKAKELVDVSIKIEDTSPIIFKENCFVLEPENKALPALVTYKGAVQYCDWLTEITRDVFRLPNQREWVTSVLSYNSILNNEKVLESTLRAEKEWCIEMYPVKSKRGNSFVLDNLHIVRGMNIDNYYLVDSSELHTFRIVREI